MGRIPPWMLMILGAGALERTSRISSLVTFSGFSARTRSSVSRFKVSFFAHKIVSGASVALKDPPPGSRVVTQPVSRLPAHKIKIGNALVVMGPQDVWRGAGVAVPAPNVF